MLAANQGNARAAGLRDQLMAKMSPQQIEEAIQQVTQFRPSGPAPTPATPPPQPAAPADAPATAPNEATPVETLPDLNAPAETPAAQ